VDTISLDDYLERHQLGHLDMLKIDVEGGELEVISGAKKSIACLRPMVICEVIDKTAQLWNYPARETIARLSEFGYEWFNFLPDGTLRVHLPTGEYPGVRNYLAVPCEKVSSLGELISRETP
jgi:hypothetical protein